MKRLLYIPVSANGERSHSRRFAADFLTALAQTGPGLQITTRDFGQAPLPHPDAGFVAANVMLDADRGASEHAALALSERLIEELEATDIVVISTPVHNYTVPSALKAWIDYIVRPRRTFGYGSSGKIGLLRDRPVFVIAACGGRFGDEPGMQRDFCSDYLRYIFATIGITDVHFVRLEELTRGADKVERARETMRTWTAQHVLPDRPEITPAA